MANGHPLNHSSNKSYLELCQRFLTAFRNKQFEGAGDLSLQSIKMAVMIVCQLLDDTISLGRKTLSALDESDWEWIKKNAAVSRRKDTRGRKNTVSRIIFVYRTISDLHRLYMHRDEGGFHLLNDGPSFPVFSSVREELALAELLGQQGGKTPDIPEEIAFPLLNAAIEYIVLFSDDILRLRDSREKYLQLWPPARDKGYLYSQRCARVGRFLLKSFDERDPTLCYVRPSGAAVGRVFGLKSQTINARGYRNLLKQFDELVSDPSNERRQRLEDEISKFESLEERPSKIRHGRASKLFLGLPYVGAEGLKAPWPVKTYADILRLEIDLWAAAYIVFAMFMADRSEDILSLETDCIVHRLDGAYLRIPNFKETNPEGGAYVEKPCPDIAVKAVEVMIALSRASRSESGSKLLFHTPFNPDAETVAQLTLNYRIRTFAKNVGADVADGVVWKYSTHQFRRLFVTIWVSYYEYGGSIEALRKYLGHNDVRTTVRYATGALQGSAVSEKTREVTLRVINSIAFEGRKVQGPAAKRYLKILSRLRIRMVPEARIAEWVLHTVDDIGARIHPLPWGYCIWSKLAGLRAKCLKEAQQSVGVERPDHKESCEACGGCSNFLKTTAFDLFWSNAAERHDRVANNPAAPKPLRVAAKAGATLARHYASLEETADA